MFCSIEPSEQRKYKAQRRKELAEHKNEPLQRGTNLASSLMFLYTCTPARPITNPHSSNSGLLSICSFLWHRQDVSGVVYTNTGTFASILRSFAFACTIASFQSTLQKTLKRKTLSRVNAALQFHDDRIIFNPLFDCFVWSTSSAQACKKLCFMCTSIVKTS